MSSLFRFSWRQVLALALSGTLLGGCASTQTSIGLGTAQGPREKAETAQY